jgi:hypothetical protein
MSNRVLLALEKGGAGSVPCARRFVNGKVVVDKGHFQWEYLVSRPMDT